MSKKVLVISGSPRKNGNSDILCDRFIEGAQESGHTVEKIRLRDLQINFCLACDACRKNNNRCVQKDDMPSVLEKMIDADAVVLATPVYFYAMCGQMKTLIDRTYPRYTELKDKEFHLIMTAADTAAHTFRTTLEEFRSFTGYVTGSNEKSAVFGMGVWNKGDVRGNKAMDEAYELGKSV